MCVNNEVSKSETCSKSVIDQETACLEVRVDGACEKEGLEFAFRRKTGEEGKNSMA